MKKIIYHIQIIRSSFWFVPLIIMIGGIILAVSFLYLDAYSQLKPSGLLQYVFTESADSARTILSVIGGAMIGIAGTVFSITLWLY
ncbi:MAG: DUF2254 domain-containing protein [Saprospiraceae bacterium]|nr:DUF2254 domain-containing protein [Saprospiraceae bacterium]